MEIIEIFAIIIFIIIFIAVISFLISNYSGTFTTHLIFINIKILNLPSNPTDFPKNQYTMTSLLIPI